MRDFVAGIARVILAAAVDHVYVVLLFTIAIEEAGIPLPVPGDLVIAFYGWRAGGDPFEIAQTILVCAAASTLGTQLPYWLSRRFGRTVTERAAYWLDIDMTKIERLFMWIDEHRFRAVVIARLIPGLRVAVSLVAGTARVPPLEFAAGVFVAGAIYWTLWVMVGVIVGPHIEDTVSPAYLKVIVIAIPAFFVLAFLVRVIVVRRRRRAAP
jgi:membrane protein DedA with SNARE-associated domain